MLAALFTPARPGPSVVGSLGPLRARGANERRPGLLAANIEIAGAPKYVSDRRVRFKCRRTAFELGDVKEILPRWLVEAAIGSGMWWWSLKSWGRSPPEPAPFSLTIGGSRMKIDCDARNHAGKQCRKAKS